MAPHTARRLEVLILAQESTRQRVCATVEVIARRLTTVVDPQTLMRHMWARIPDVIIVEAAAHLTNVPILCRHIRQFFQTPILIVEDGAREDERISWLDSGADDVLALAAQAELAARCVALLRRIQRQQRHNPTGLYIHAFDLQLDIVGYRLYLAQGQCINLSADQARLLAIFLSYGGGIVPDEALEQHMADRASPYAESRLPELIRRLNRCLAAMSGQQPQVKRVRGSGYRLSFSVVAPPDRGPASARM